MSSASNWWSRALIGGCVTMCTVFAMAATGKPEKNPGAYATVDFNKIQTDYKAKSAAEAEIRAMQDKLDQALARRDSMPFLTEDEQQELDKLTDKDPTQRTDAEKKRIQELTDKGTQMSNEVKALQQKSDKDLTDADKKRIRDAEQTFVNAQKVFAKMKEDRDSKLKEFATTQSEQLMKSVRAAIARVAEQKGIAIVFNSEVAPYAGIDITSSVLSELNKK